VSRHMKPDISVLSTRYQWYMAAASACGAEFFGVEKANDDIKQCQILKLMFLKSSKWLSVIAGGV
jgi:hypothetical protein